MTLRLRLKYRAWDFEQECMIPDTEVKRAFDKYYNQPRYNVTMWVGLYDDEGYEIFCGDIVKVQDTTETKTPHISIVYFTACYGAFVLGHPVHRELGIGNIRHLRDYAYYGREEQHPCKCELLDNIYENPELCEKLEHQ